MTVSLPIYQVDAFTKRLFGGNPAAVVPLTEYPADHIMQSIAAENNLSETAFLVPQSDGSYFIRWFTPNKEVRLCGHATLASAHVLFQHLSFAGYQITFQTRSVGNLRVTKAVNGGYSMDFPADSPQQFDLPAELAAVLGVPILAATRGTDDALVLLESEAQLRSVQPDFRLLGTLEDYRGLIATAPGDEVDFVSRCFYPHYGIDEDPVTGSAHTLLTPFWAKKLDKTELSARQISSRVGDVSCYLRDKRVVLSGHAVTYLYGTINATL